MKFLVNIKDTVVIAEYSIDIVPEITRLKPLLNSS